MNPELFPAVAQQLLRALRGRRSQKGFSARIGYRSNIAQRWETGACFPTAGVFLAACAKLNSNAVHCFREFFKRTPVWFDPKHPFSSSAIAAFLRELRGKTPIGELAERTGFNRYSVGRWLKGTAQPKLPEFLALIEASSRRMADFVATLIDPSLLPSLSGRWAELQAARSVAYEHPWSHAVLRALEIEGVPSAGEARIAEILGIDEGTVRGALAALCNTGQVVRARGRWQTSGVLSVDTSRDETRSWQLKDVWFGVARERLQRKVAGTFGFSLFAVSRADLQRLREVQLEYVRAMQSIIAGSARVECVGLYCSQLMDLAAPVVSAAAPAPAQRASR